MLYGMIGRHYVVSVVNPLAVYCSIVMISGLVRAVVRARQN